MVPPKGAHVGDVLAKFRSQQAKAAKIQSDAAKEREEKLKKIQGGGVKKTTSARPSKSRAKSTTSSGPAASDAPSGSGSAAAAAAADWKTQAPRSTLPLGMRQKQVIDFLRQKEAPATLAEIAASTGRDVGLEADLAVALEANPKVAVDSEARTFTYLPEANVRNREQLLEYIQRSGAPVAVNEVADAYRAVMDDVRSLKAEGLVLGLHSYDPEVNCEVLYALDSKLQGLVADAEVAALWAAAELPDEDDDMAAEMRKAGIEPVPRKAVRKRSASERKKKARKASKLRAVTNVHLLHLLEGEGPAAIDALE